MLQKITRTARVRGPERPPFVVFLVGLSRRAQILPSTLFIDGVECKDRNAVAGGGFADIYRGLFGGQEVALKRIRTFTNDSAADEEEQVSSRYTESLA